VRLQVSTALVDINQRQVMPVLDLEAKVELHEGKPRLVPESWSRWHTALGREVGRRVTVSITRHRMRRSAQANRYLWGVVYRELLQELRILAQDSGERCPFEDEQQLHDAMKYLFLGTEPVSIGGVEIQRPATTTTLDLEQFSAYISAIKRMAAQRWNIYISEAE
jgi:hypothetical protein